ncbi:MAG: hypothetical protein IJQ86_03615 [Spirochaetia bacterium]|nr:hypothetical protein [Spirochaetia bacterium]
MKKLSVLLLALLLILTFASCGGSGGSDDDEDDATWPVEFYSEVGGGSSVSAMRTAPSTGTYKYIYFYKDGKYESGDLNNGTLNKTGEGSYSGGDPHNNITLRLTGTFEGSTLSGESVAISSGSLTVKGVSFTRAGNSGDVTPPAPAVTWPVSYQCDEGGGVFAFVDFKEDGTYCFGESNDVNNHAHDPGSIGTYIGDPHTDGVVYVTGLWDTGDVNNHPVTISSGAFDFGPFSMVRQGSGGGGGNVTPPAPAVTWPVSYQCDEGGGVFAFVDFEEGGTYCFGESNDVNNHAHDPGSIGTYTGDPRDDGTIYVTGLWDTGDVNNHPVTISSGAFNFGPFSMVRQ